MQEETAVIFRRRKDSRQRQDLEIIGTAVMTGLGRMMIACAMMLRMDVLACHPGDENGQERALAATACMNAETYDTHQVPYRKQYRAYFIGHISHYSRKCTKNIQK